MSPALDQFAKGLQPPVDAQAVASVRLSGFGVGISGKSPKGLKLLCIISSFIVLLFCCYLISPNSENFSKDPPQSVSR